MSTQNNPKRIALIQMNSIENVSENYTYIKNQVRKAVAKGVSMIFLPEGFDYISPNPPSVVSSLNKPGKDLIEKFQKLCLENSIWMSLGGYHEQMGEKKTDGNPWYCNTHLVINNQGAIVSMYRKIHLFEMDSPELGIRMREATNTLPGDTISSPVKTPIGKIGLGICYDVRFPEFSSKLVELGAEILTFPSAFTVATGAQHWEPLLRARAIENQCYVVAAAQVGEHHETRQSYGHSMVIDPSGQIIAEADDKDRIIYADIDVSLVKKTRTEMPVLLQKRPVTYKLYSVINKYWCPEECSDYSYKFGKASINSGIIFLENSYAYSFVHHKGVLPGHVAVALKRVVPRIRDCTILELTGLFLLVKLTQEFMEYHHGVDSSTIAMQDGEDAGQAVRHVHVHVVPRTYSDYSNVNQVYSEIENIHKNNLVRPKSFEEMSTEGKTLREVCRLQQTKTKLVVPSPASVFEFYNMNFVPGKYEEQRVPSSIKPVDPAFLSDVPCWIPPFQAHDEGYRFGAVTVLASHIFLENEYAFAFVNKRCVRAGHVVVSSKRMAKRLPDLTEMELKNFVSLIQKTCIVMEQVHETEASSVTIQDGVNAGQSIEHIHAHVIPRTKDDHLSRKLYSNLESHDKGVVTWREDFEMDKECVLIKRAVRNVNLSSCQILPLTDDLEVESSQGSSIS